MNNPIELMAEKQEFPQDTIAKWLRLLFYVHLICTAAAVISWLPIRDGWLTWTQRVFIIAAIISLFQLAPANPHYRKAAIFRAVYLGGILVNALIFSGTILLLGASICSLISVYQEYNAHSQLIAQQDPKLSRNWHSLFTWSIAASLLISLGSMILAVLAVLSEIQITTVVSVITLILSIPGLVVDIFYLAYLNRTIRVIEHHD